jgi:hypothetical protein
LRFSGRAPAKSVANFHIILQGALAEKASRMAFRWRVVKDYDMITRRKTLRRQKDAGESYQRVVLWAKSIAAWFPSFHLARCLIENAPSGDCAPATLLFALNRLRLTSEAWT